MGRHGVRLFFQWFGDKVGVGGALGGVFAAIKAVGVVNAVGAVGASVQAEGVGGGVEVVRISAVDTEESAVLCDKDRRVCQTERCSRDGNEDCDDDEVLHGGSFQFELQLRG